MTYSNKKDELTPFVKRMNDYDQVLSVTSLNGEIKLGTNES